MELAIDEDPNFFAYTCRLGMSDNGDSSMPPLNKNEGFGRFTEPQKIILNGLLTLKGRISFIKMYVQ